MGTRLTLILDTPDGERTIHRAVGSVSSFGGSPLPQEIGLGNAAAIRSLKVYWPVSNTTQIFANLSLDSSIRVTEGKQMVEAVGLEKVRLKAGPGR